MYRSTRSKGINIIVRIFYFPHSILDWIIPIPKDPRKKIYRELIRHHNFPGNIVTDSFIIDQNDKQLIIDQILHHYERERIKWHENLICHFVKYAPNQSIDCCLDDYYFIQLRLQFDLLKEIYQFLNIKSTVPKEMETAESILARAPARFQPQLDSLIESESGLIQNSKEKCKEFSDRLVQEMSLPNPIFKILSMDPMTRSTYKPFFQFANNEFTYTRGKSDFKAFVNWLFTVYFSFGEFYDLSPNQKNVVYREFLRIFKPEFIRGTNISAFMMDKSFGRQSYRSGSNQYENLVSILTLWGL